MRSRIALANAAAPAMVVPTSVQLGMTPFAVVDVETTGFSPRLHDRMIEVAVVRMAANGAIEDEYVTLLNPERDIGATSFHNQPRRCLADSLPGRRVAALRA